ncbi:MAG: hypothetical protein QM704_18815 [Anaeromyxobacteraceae bacterium]
MKPLARLVAVLGAVGVGVFLFRSAPRDVVLVYGLPPSPAPAVLEVELVRGGEPVRHAELAAPTAGGEVRHAVKLSDGTYVLRWRLGQGASARAGERPLEVTEDGTIVVPLAR